MPEILAKTDLIARAARMLHSSGTPADRLERALGTLAAKIGLAGQFFSTPTSLMMTLRSPDGIETRLERLEPGTLNLERLGAIDEWIGQVVTGGSVAAASAELALIESAPDRYGARLHVVGNALVTGAAASVFGGSAADAALAAALGALVAVVTLLTQRADASNRLAELLSAFLVAFASAAAAARWAGLSPAVIVLSSLIPMFPGLNLTIAIREIAARHLVSGSARFAGTLVVFLTLGAGAAIGTRAATWWVGAPSASESAGLPDWFLLPALLASALGFGISFHARPRDFPWILVAAALALAGSRLAVPSLGPELGTSATSFVVGVAGNVFSRVFRRTSSVMMVPGLVLLVPGTIGFQSVSALMHQDTLVGIQAAFSVLTVGISLAMGLLLASALVPSRREL